MKTDLSTFDNEWYKPGNTLKIFLWYFTNVLFFLNPLFPFSGFKVILLRLFGAVIGKGVLIKPGVNIKYPWMLEIGDHCWIGEKVWIDNLGEVKMGNNVCISQGAMLLCGNHDYTRESFDLITKEIILEDGVWIGAQSIVTPGIICRTHSILTVNSVATRNMDPYFIYQGNPAIKVRARKVPSGISKSKADIKQL